MAVTLLGNGPELHDRLAGAAGDFSRIEPLLPTADEVLVAARRTNVFHLAAITQYAVERRGGRVEVPPLDPHPVSNLPQRFGQHLSLLQRAAAPYQVRVMIDDAVLPQLLAHVACRADPHNETDLLRVLGVVCDTALVGPHWFVFEVINRCNAHCRFCNIHSPRRQPASDFLNAKLPFAVFESTCRDLARMGTDGVTILANGEPTLHPDFARMITTARDCGLRVNFFTNGLLLDEAKAELVVRDEVDEMFCTVSAATPETYAELHGDAGAPEWRKLLANLRRLFEVRRLAGHGKPTAWMVNVICAPNAREILAMADLAGELGFDGFRPQLLRVDDYNRDLALTPEDVAYLQSVQGELESRLAAKGVELWDSYAPQLRHAGDNPDLWSGDEFIDHGCFVGYSLGLAKSNGDLSFCCTVKPVANLADGSFRQHWAGGLYHRARLSAKNLRVAGDLRLLDGKTLYTEACHHCDNHDINRRMHEMMDRYDMWRFLA
ncbi:MAG: radical SAM protein [Candidatus Lernaella stagnicola]|nr:radical SAM protein [Candidatus Lernaella stagnicola]